MRLLILLIGLFISLSSCKVLLIKSLIKNPRVENAESIRDFQKSNGYNTEYSYVLSGDTASAEMSLFRGLKAGFYVFDKNGDQLCYNGSSTCTGVQFKELLNAKSDFFQSCKNDSISLSRTIEECITLNNKKAKRSDLPEADYYVVNYWQKFMGGKRAYKENIIWMEDEIRQIDTSIKIAFVKINTDLQENWGLQFGKTAKMKIMVNKGYMQMNITDFPYKKTQSK